jgi:hypothetical protein
VTVAVGVAVAEVVVVVEALAKPRRGCPQSQSEALSSELSNFTFVGVATTVL